MVQKNYNKYNLVFKGDILIFFLLISALKSLKGRLLISITIFFAYANSEDSGDPSLFAHLSCKLWGTFGQRTKVLDLMRG